jgi:polyisoprenoid-binding protein YceI
MTVLLALLVAAAPEAVASAPAAPPVPAPAQVFALGPHAGKMQFQAFSRLVDSKGRFHSWRGKVSVPNADLSKASIEVTVDIASIDTANDKRDSHLKTADFFNAPKWPVAVFRAQGLKSLGGDRYTVSGKLKLMGVSKAVSFPALVTLKGGKLAIKADFKIDRTVWGMTGYQSSFSVNPIQTTVRVFFDLKSK